jgi:hypothetical protein
MLTIGSRLDDPSDAIMWPTAITDVSKNPPFVPRQAFDQCSPIAEAAC